jgi:hypothetical protein
MLQSAAEVVVLDIAKAMCLLSEDVLLFKLSS